MDNDVVNEFNNWKQNAITKHDECYNNQISIEEYTNWLDKSFPNRTPKNK